MTTTGDGLFDAAEIPAGQSWAHHIIAATEPIIAPPTVVRRGRKPQPITLDCATRGARRTDQALRWLEITMAGLVLHLK